MRFLLFILVQVLFGVIVALCGVYIMEDPLKFLTLSVPFAVLSAYAVRGN